MTIYVVIGLIILVTIYFLVQYNSFITLNNLVKEAFATMDVYLKKRWDLIPNLVEVVKGYSKHESAVMENVIQLRNLSYDKMSLSDKIDTNTQLSNDITKLIAIAESYPDLKASQNFLDLSSSLTQVEDEIANSRKYYNAVVRKFNIKVETFPSNLIAKIFKFKVLKMFEIDENQKVNVKVNL